MAANRPYSEFYDFYSVSLEYFGYTLVTQGHFNSNIQSSSYRRCRISSRTHISLSLSLTHSLTHTHLLPRSYREISTLTLSTSVLTKFSHRRYYPCISAVFYSKFGGKRSQSIFSQTKSSTDVQKKGKRLALTFSGT
jgi:hypothetical protein